MTTRGSRHGEQGATTPIGSAGHPRALNAETLRHWQSDLEHFVSGIRDRLQSLSQSISNYETKQQSIAQQASKVSEQSVTFLQDPADNKTPKTGFLDHEPNSVGHHAGAVTDSAPTHSNEDPADRLNAIKLQLAKQLENK